MVLVNTEFLATFTTGDNTHFDGPTFYSPSIGQNSHHSHRAKIIAYYQMFNEIKEKGWIEIEKVDSVDSAISLAKDIGNIIPHPNGQLWRKIRPNEKMNSYSGTMSHQFGHSDFPLHTDTAFWPRPTRFVLLASFSPNCTNSTIIRTSQLIKKLDCNTKKLMEKAIYLVKTPNKQFYTSLKIGHDIGFKFDICCMTPYNRAAKAFHDEFIKLVTVEEVEEIKWTGNKAVVFDNWNVLHGRKALKDKAQDRNLIRIYIDELESRTII